VATFVEIKNAARGGGFPNVTLNQMVGLVAGARNCLDLLLIG